MKEAEKEGIDNIKPVLGEHRKTNLPENSVDVIVIIRTYHHFEYPLDMLASIKGALRPEGRFIVIDRERIRGNSSEWELNHWRAGKGTFTDEIVDAGFMLEKDLPLIPGNYYLVFTHR
jgi:ubiquinone/menaquinone biosynthesis C-methylase UbiE